MAIKGLTDRGQAFPQIGNIRKGDTGGKNGAPRDLQWFRVEFDEKEIDAIQAFSTAYAAHPTEINILLPFNEIERCWDAWCEAYTAGRMVARSDGENFLFLVDIKTGEVVVKDGLNKAGNKEPHREVIGRTDKSVIKCRPVGRMKVLIPELRRLAYVVVHTTSVIDIRNLSEQLEAIKQINGGRIVGIPLVLRRRPKAISVPKPDGTHVRLTKWMLSIEADPKWVTAKLIQMDRLALPEGNIPLALPGVSAEQETENEQEAEDEQEGDWNWEDELEPEEEPQPEPAKSEPVALNGKPAVITQERIDKLNAAGVTPLTLEMAEAELSREGDRYGEMESEDLQYRLKGLAGVKNASPIQAHKIECIRMILKAREGGRKVQTPQPLEGQEPLL